MASEDAAVSRGRTGRSDDRGYRRLGALLTFGALLVVLTILRVSRLTAILATVLAVLLVVATQDVFTAVDDQGVMSFFALLWRYRNTDFVAFRAKHAQHFQLAEETNNYVPAVCHYYQLMSDLITLTSGPLWHFVPMPKGLTRKQCHEQFNHVVVKKLQAVPDDRILEFGCGFGEIGRQVAHLSGARVTGLTIADEEIAGGNERIARAGLQDQCEMVQGNYHKMPFEANTFSKVFGIYTLKYSHSLDEAFAELARVLKPGGLLMAYEIRCTDKYDAGNSLHRDYMYHISFSTGMPPLWPGASFREAAEKAGLVLKEEVDLCNAENAWYACFERTGIYSILRSTVIKQLVRLAEALHLVPRDFSGFYDDHLVHPTVDFVEGGRLGIIDGAVLMLWQKP